MKSHVLRPLWVVIGFVALVLAGRALVVPEDFGAHEMGYRFGWHRKGNEQEWKDFPAKYASREYCRPCHAAEWDMIGGSPHAAINCQNCHGPALGHPGDPVKLPIDRDRTLCLRCHAKLPYEQTGRARIPGIGDEAHNPGMPCATCHNPHAPGVV
jgi:hypothetical protein